MAANLGCGDRHQEKGSVVDVSKVGSALQGILALTRPTLAREKVYYTSKPISEYLKASL